MTDTLPNHGGQLRAIASRYAVAEEDLLDFSANIAPGGPPASVLAALESALRRHEVITQYPDLEHAELKAAIARAVGVPEQCITIASGFVPLLEAFLDTLYIRRCLLPVPAFVEYRRVLEQRGVEISPLMWQEDRGFAYDVQHLLCEATRSGCDAILLANPQNPSGELTSARALRDLVQAAAEQKIHILLDEAFIDYAPEETLTTLAAQTSNLTVFRSVTKFYAMPGLRVAYAVGESRQITAVERRLAPWPVSTLASIAVSAALVDHGYAHHVFQRNFEARQWLVRELEKLGHHVYSSIANFVLIRLNERIDASTFWERMIREHGMVLRVCGNYDGLDTRFYRIAVRSSEDNHRLIDALQKI